MEKVRTLYKKKFGRHLEKPENMVHRCGHRGPVGRKTTQKPPQNTKKWKKIVKKRLFSRFGHFGQNSDFSRKKSKTGIFFDITKPPLAQIYPKSGL